MLAAGCVLEFDEPQAGDTLQPDVPVTDAPVTDAPVTDAPVTDAPIIDAPSTPDLVPVPDSTPWPCPSACNGGCAGNTCTINRGANTGSATCPAGWSCVINCTGDKACESGVNCSQGKDCQINCDNPGGSLVACNNGKIRCGTGHCTAVCIGKDACQLGVDCKQSCGCHVTCSGDQACNDGISCPTAATCCSPPLSCKCP